MAASQGVRATDLWRAGIVDRVVPERPDAADEPVEFCLRLGRVLAEELAGLLGRDDVERMRSRTRRWRHLGR
jgi:acetyl-CoA carboxylase carboxyl transferase subunit beta